MKISELKKLIKECINEISISDWEAKKHEWKGVLSDPIQYTNKYVSIDQNWDSGRENVDSLLMLLDKKIPYIELFDTKVNPPMGTTLYQILQDGSLKVVSRNQDSR